MPKELLRGTLGIAAEYAVASELCRRGIYAQLTLGHQKKTDLLVFFESGQLARIEVKAKQGREWPNCKGISRSDTYLVFVGWGSERRMSNGIETCGRRSADDRTLDG